MGGDERVSPKEMTEALEGLLEASLRSVAVLLRRQRGGTGLYGEEVKLVKAAKRYLKAYPDEVPDCWPGNRR